MIDLNPYCEDIGTQKSQKHGSCWCLKEVILSLHDSITNIGVGNPGNLLEFIDCIVRYRERTPMYIHPETQYRRYYPVDHAIFA